jgi:hypothetical protein
LLVGDSARRADSRLVIESSESSIDKPLTPFANRLNRASVNTSHGRVVHAFGAGKDEARPKSEVAIDSRPPHEAAQLFAILFGYNQLWFRTTRETHRGW